MTPLCAGRSSSSSLASTSYCPLLSSSTEAALVRWRPPSRPKRRKATTFPLPSQSALPPLLSRLFFSPPPLFFSPPPPRRRLEHHDRSYPLNAVNSEGFSQGARGGEGDRAEQEPDNSAGEVEVEVESSADAAPPLPPPPAPPPPPSSPATTDPGADAITPLLPVPWGLDTVCGVMLLWLLAFWSLGHIVVPGALEFAGLPPRDALPPRAAAAVHLLLEVSELAATAFVLWRALRGYRPRALGWFRADLGRPLRRWALPLLLVAAAFPLVESAAAAASALPGLPDAVWSFFQVVFPSPPPSLSPSSSQAALPAAGAPALEAAVAAGDKATCALYLAVVAVAAPLWEEAIFRGFLLASLAGRVPRRWAVVGSAVVFALAHFAPHRAAALLLLGLLFGWLYSRTGSLGAAVLAHSLWNLYIFAGLLLGRGAAGGVVV